MSKVSIVVPIYNVEKYLNKCLDSLLVQSYKDIKIYLVNDGSKDNSKEIIDEYINKYPDMMIGLNKENGGLSDARNYGLGYVDSEYVMFVDSDDYVEEDYVKKALTQIELDNSDICIFNYYSDNLSNGNSEIIKHHITPGVYSLKNNHELLAYTSNAAWNKIYKTSLFKDNDIYYPKGLLYEDLATTTRLLTKCNKISYIDDPLYHYQVGRSGQITSKASKDIINVCKLIIDYFKDNNIFNTYYDELYYLCNINLIEILRSIINYENRDDVKEYIDEIFDFKDEYFKKKSNKYDLIKKKTDYVYLNKTTCLAYSYLKGKKK